MLYCIFVPLFFSWLLKKAAWKRTYLSYVFSALTVLLISAAAFIISMLNSDALGGAPDIIAVRGSIVAFAGSAAIQMAVVLFFQFIFNKTFAISDPKA